MRPLVLKSISKSSSKITRQKRLSEPSFPFKIRRLRVQMVMVVAFINLIWFLLELNLVRQFYPFSIPDNCSKRGDYKSIVLLLQGFKIFSDTSGLQANVCKSAVYCHGMIEEEVNRILLVSGFIKSPLPFRYHGIAICSKRISLAECNVLVEKLIHRIRICSTRHLSFASRLTLVNAVLMSIHLYWAQVMILLKALLDRVNQICKAFLWHGTPENNGPAYVSWGDVCKNKIEGGLGLRNIVY
ncbi:uncharacterized protein LOC133814640 [Humulus lupulus]|uniref:uncharacterized protein LOC133814640 n=1 Tax=Humulus lupulus TaxID=3486 RepID=UPI002B415A88|nr:uncharacterized protein LOC133814640 [Humulus lupulus]